MRLARNLIIDDYRHRQRNPQNSMADAVDDHQYHLRAVGTSAHKEMERRELASQVQNGIDKLPGDLKTCVILAIDEMSYQGSRVLQSPEGTVKRDYRGRIEWRDFKKNEGCNGLRVCKNQTKSEVRSANCG